MQTETNIPYNYYAPTTSAWGIPETNSVEGVPSVTGREIPSAATKATLSAGRVKLGTALSKVIY